MGEAPQLSPEERALRLREITTLMERGAPRANGQRGHGSMAGVFNEWVTEQKTLLLTEPVTAEEKASLTKEERDVIDTPPGLRPNDANHAGIVNKIIQHRLPALKAEIARDYVNGVARTPTQPPDAETAGVINDAASMVGLEQGGFFTRMLGKIPVVGEFILAGMKVLGSAFGSLLDAVGLGDGTSKLIMPGEALAQVRNKNAYIAGIGAISNRRGMNAAAMLAELEAGVGNTPPPVTLERAPDSYKTNEEGEQEPLLNRGMNRAQLIEYLETLKTPDGKPHAPSQALKAYLEKNPKAFAEGSNHVVVTSSAGGVALATVEISPSGTEMTVKTAKQLKDGLLVAVPNLQTGLKLPTGAAPKLEFQVTSAAVIPGTLSDDLQSLKTNMSALRAEVPRGTALPKEAPEEIRIIVNAMGDIPDNKLPEAKGLKHMLVRLPGNEGYAIASGTFNEKTNQFNIQKISKLNKDGEFETKSLTVQVPEKSIMPILFGAKAIDKTQSKDIQQFKNAVLGSDPKLKPISDALVDNTSALKSAMDKAIEDAGSAPEQEKMKANLRVMAVTLPGGASAIVVGQYDQATDAVTPVTMLRIKENGKFALAESVIGTPPIPSGKNAPAAMSFTPGNVPPTGQPFVPPPAVEVAPPPRASGKQ